MSKFLELLILIRSYGPKIPAIMEKVEHIIVEFQELYEMLKPGLFASVALSGEEQAELDAILAECPPKGPLADLFAWLKANPDLILFLLKIFAK